MNCGDIRGWIGVVAQRGKLGLSVEEALASAWSILTDVNPFPAALGRICPHPCESHCNRGNLDEPLAINAMERFLGDFGIRSQLPLGRLEEPRAEAWVGVVGAGPSGLSFAYQMARRGYRVTVYDARKKAGGMLRYGVPDYRLPPDILDAEIQKILDLGVELELRTAVGRDVSLADLRARHSHLYLGIGAQKGRPLDIPGAEGPGVWTGADYLRRVNNGEAVDTGKHAIVIGGGNSAMDAARCALRNGSQVTILYRRSLEEMPALEHEITDALEEGIKITLLAAPVRIERRADGRMKTVVAQHMRLGPADSSGRRRPVPIEGSRFTLPANSLIAAVSQVPVLEGLEGLQHAGDWLVADAAGSVNERVMVGGDALGLGVAGNAIIQGRHAAEALHERLTGRRPARGEDPEQPEISPERVLFASKSESEAVHSVKLPGAERASKGMTEVASTITEADFLAEVERCYSCGSCFGCEQCFMYCTAGCYTRVEEAAPGMYFTLNLDQCEECGKCIEVCPCGFLEETVEQAQYEIGTVSSMSTGREDASSAGGERPQPADAVGSGRQTR